MGGITHLRTLHSSGLIDRSENSRAPCDTSRRSPKPRTEIEIREQDLDRWPHRSASLPSRKLQRGNPVLCFDKPEPPGKFICDYPTCPNTWQTEESPDSSHRRQNRPRRRKQGIVKIIRHLFELHKSSCQGKPKVRFRGADKGMAKWTSDSRTLDEIKWTSSGGKCMGEPQKVDAYCHKQRWVWLHEKMDGWIIWDRVEEVYGDGWRIIHMVWLFQWTDIR